MPNRLAAESSPYLRQHADNPVDWWPWGEAAFAEAEDNALALVDGLQRVDEHYRRGAIGADPGGLRAQLLIAAGQQLAERCDPKHGGLGGAPKFPSCSTHALLARASRLSFGEAA